MIPGLSNRFRLFGVSFLETRKGKNTKATKALRSIQRSWRLCLSWLAFRKLRGLLPLAPGRRCGRIFWRG